MPNAQFPSPKSQCPIPNSQFPIPNSQFPLPKDEIEDFCSRWQVSELALFGSVLRDDFRPDSDIDLLISFSPNADWSLLDHARMQQELMGIVRRKVDLVSKRARGGLRGKKSCLMPHAQCPIPNSQFPIPNSLRI